MSYNVDPMIIKNSTLHLNTEGFCHVVNITDEVQSQVNESKIESGNVTVFVVGSTVGSTVV